MKPKADLHLAYDLMKSLPPDNLIRSGFLKLAFRPVAFGLVSSLLQNCTKKISDYIL